MGTPLRSLALSPNRVQIMFNFPIRERWSHLNSLTGYGAALSTYSKR